MLRNILSSMDSRYSQSGRLFRSRFLRKEKRNKNKNKKQATRLATVPSETAIEDDDDDDAMIPRPR